MAQAMGLNQKKIRARNAKKSLKSGPISRTVFRSTFLIPLNRKVLEKGPFYGPDFGATVAAKLQYTPNIVMQFSHAPLSRPGQSLLRVLGDTCADTHAPLTLKWPPYDATTGSTKLTQKASPAQPHSVHPKQRRTGKLK